MLTLASVSFPALGTTATLVTVDPTALDEAQVIVDEVLADIDKSCSRFRNDSHLMQVNARAGSWVTVEPTFLDALSTALDAARLTDGDLDPTIGAALRAVGYDRTFADVAQTQQGVVAMRRVPGWQTIEIDERGQRVRLAPGTQLDFGATAKALAADRAMERIQERLGVGALLSLGGDIALGGQAPEGGWRIDLAEHHASTNIRQQITVTEGAIATSTTTARTWMRNNERQHHILDPATGLPATVVWRTVSVTAARCVDANIAATTAIIRGAEAVPFLEAFALDAYLLHADGWSTTVGRWPEDEL